MAAERWLFLSDLHLAPGEARQGEAARFLLEFPGLTHLCLGGDLFDFYYGFRDREMAGFETFLAALRQLHERGVVVHYVEGNHDFHLTPRFTARYGARVHPDGVALTLGGARVWVEHGDTANPEERLQHWIRRAFRSRTASWIAEAVGPVRLQRFGRWLDRATSPEGYERRTTAHPCFRARAAERIAAGFDVVVLGHAHVPADEVVEAGGRRGRYLNTGDWVAHRSYVTWDPEAGFRLHDETRAGEAAPAPAAYCR
ncbi:MAG: UDP-2,3-diacylglucosamine diphosphatase [Nitrospirae bacterium]|nr:MAG: UDP-2,3-diacylglucosamine diphosphatase [Nitrospirota bacterium]